MKTDLALAFEELNNHSKRVYALFDGEYLAYCALTPDEADELLKLYANIAGIMGDTEIALSSLDEGALGYDEETGFPFLHDILHPLQGTIDDLEDLLAHTKYGRKHDNRSR